VFTIRAQHAGVAMATRMTAQLEEAVNNMGFMMQHDGRGRQTAWHTLAKLR